MIRLYLLFNNQASIIVYDFQFYSKKRCEGIASNEEAYLELGHRFKDYRKLVELNKLLIS